ncbi:nSTAND3 domain-containing NTPase [Acidithrix ferrooxidans]|uniref:Novel STAND NTPase 3 domain-containing protein n=1 Tax=Acidithrix ferrooxidans TaxID=1280514 RepID=A0A0D8HJU9_9ACTN|nr:hypothetical protein [Acidithrix ferrooxidans]KJF18174.1 hypothetical protein AXFE_09190 [Acidithrix ferrooxidans]
MTESLSYDLHKLGWRAFQDLSAVILQTVLGATFKTFADSNDGGRDGAFYGNWTTTFGTEVGAASRAAPAAATVMQCKFSASGRETLTPSALAEELEKAASLHERGLCDAYILMTNLRVTGKTEGWIQEELRARGINAVEVFDGHWICQQISKEAGLRRYVPRVYGLGDLGQILDNRRLQQAIALLSRLGDDVATFVPTASYRQAADALAGHGFTLLLGAPAAGKSTIAATLSVVALDVWRCGVRRVDSAEELIAAWNPREPDQLFWVDDAFGAIRHDSQLTDQWSRRMDQVMTAVKGGAKIILTSRDYIYRQARVHLKEYVYPLLHEQAVVVDVAQLTNSEKRQILYSHLKAGNQPGERLRRWRSNLPDLAVSERFQPELARRLSQTRFTTSITDNRKLMDFFDHPAQFLKDVLFQLADQDRAALACVYLAGDGLPVPVNLSETALHAVARMGSTEQEVLTAFQHLRGTFLALSSTDDGNQLWRFQHPTIREGFASMIADDPNAVEILLDGLTNDEMLRQIDCGGGEQGLLVVVPASLYTKVSARVCLTDTLDTDNWYSPLAEFLGRRCSDDFLRLWVGDHVGDLKTLLNFAGFMGVSWRPLLLARLHRAGVLPEHLRLQAVELLERLAIEDFDNSWLDVGVVGLFSELESGALLVRFQEECLPDLDDFIDSSADGYDSEVSPAERYQFARDTVSAYLRVFDDPGVKCQLEDALARIEARVASAEEDFDPPSRSSFAPALQVPLVASGRDEFDDVDEGHS